MKRQIDLNKESNITYVAKLQRPSDSHVCLQSLCTSCLLTMISYTQRS